MDVDVPLTARRRVATLQRSSRVLKSQIAMASDDANLADMLSVLKACLQEIETAISDAKPPAAKAAAASKRLAGLEEELTLLMERDAEARLPQWLLRQTACEIRGEE